MLWIKVWEVNKIPQLDLLHFYPRDGTSLRGIEGSEINSLFISVNDITLIFAKLKVIMNHLRIKCEPCYLRTLLGDKFDNMSYAIQVYYTGKVNSRISYFWNKKKIWKCIIFHEES